MHTPPAATGPQRLTHSTEVCKTVLPLLRVDQVISALLGGCSLQHCFKQRAGGGSMSPGLQMTCLRAGQCHCGPCQEPAAFADLS